MIMSKRLLIRSVERKDFEKIHKIKNHPDVIAGEGHFFSLPMEKLEKIYTSYFSDNNRKALVIVDRRSKKVIGEISLDIDWPNRCADVGITVEKDKWGMGIATEALKAIMDHVFNKMALNRLQAWVLSTNKASLKAFERAGFVKEGVSRKAKVHNGSFTDIIWVSALANCRKDCC